jgi:hypothetical protein
MFLGHNTSRTHPYNSTYKRRRRMVFRQRLLDELLALERLREHPVRRRDAVRGDRPAPPAGDLERQRLAAEVGVALPVLAPVPPHRDPPGPRPLHLHGGHLAVGRHVGDQHLQEVRAAGDREPHAARPVAAHPASPTFTNCSAASYSEKKVLLFF